MRVAHLVFSFNSGGIEHLLVDALNYWPIQDELLLCIVNDSFDQTLIDSICKHRNVNIEFLHRRQGSGKLPYLKKLNALLSRFRPDVVHCHSNNVLLFSLPLKFLHPRWKFVYTVHDTNIYNRLSHVNIALHKLFVSHITAISKSVYQNIVDSGFPESRVTVVHNGVDPSKFGPHKERHDGNEPRTIICVARLLPEKKGQDILIDALAELARGGETYRCLFVGAAPAEHPEYRQQLIDRAGEHQLSDVEFLGNRNDIPHLLAQSDAFVLPSRYEGFGISIIEAMMAKVPVIASAVDGPKEIIGDNTYGVLFESGDSGQLASAIHHVMVTDNQAMVETAYRHALDDFSIDAMVDGFRAVYRTTVGR
ncbi:glycosyltransferase [Bifidobacterium reuteri DSM 23975]|uniref:Glycosyltransferase n=1 Tax=Bifidobacterium reuteri DSM 23975 TaxID=1437610 RepID=A0A087CXP1_9BIFI|nr:glycosyltransferase family 4 protein [Bifidobacterium reuteri]KFI88041.1 glycosyltransferase [Bifidobacterium reuteri DSM 23975]